MVLYYGLPNLPPLIVGYANFFIEITNSTGESQCLPSFRKNKAKVDHSRLGQIVASGRHAPEHIAIIVVGKL